MKHLLLKYAVWAALLLSAIAGALWLWPNTTRAQAWPPDIQSTTPMAQRNAMNNVKARVQWLKDATRTAPGYGTGGDGLVWRSLQALRLEYMSLTRSLTGKQRSYGANQLEELAAGLDILQETYGNYQQDLAAGRSPGQALRDWCQILNRAVDVWMQEFVRDCNRLRIGWG